VERDEPAIPVSAPKKVKAKVLRGPWNGTVGLTGRTSMATFEAARGKQCLVRTNERAAHRTREECYRDEEGRISWEEGGCPFGIELVGSARSDLPRRELDRGQLVDRRRRSDTSGS
jgi:hypothetical protein